MSVNLLLHKYELSERVWSRIVKRLLKHLVTIDLFPQCEGGDDDLVTQLLSTFNLLDLDKEEEIYATVRYLRTRISYVCSV